MRLFTAIPLPQKTKEEVAEITRGRLPIPYINTTNLHITLNFFGELSDAEVKKVKNIFASIAQHQNAFEVEFEGIVKHRQQIHLTIKPNQMLSALQSKFEKEFESQGFHFQDRAYYPHVNLGNLHMDKVMNSERRIENFPKEELTKLNFRAQKIILYESKLLLHHPKHIPVAEQELT